MSMYGWKLMCDGIQWNVERTSPSVLIDEITMVYSGKIVRKDRIARPRTRVTTDPVPPRLRIAGTSDPEHAQVRERDEHQEQQQQHGHRGAQPEVEVDER